MRAREPREETYACRVAATMDAKGRGHLLFFLSSPWGRVNLAPSRILCPCENSENRYHGPVFSLAVDRAPAKTLKSACRAYDLCGDCSYRFHRCWGICTEKINFDKVEKQNFHDSASFLEQALLTTATRCILPPFHSEVSATPRTHPPCCRHRHQSA